jgi:predicted PurR-regulated permease PerM
MYPADSKARSSVAVLVILIAFAWIGCAYIMGTEAERMLFHPIVPILLVLLLFSFKGDRLVRRVSTIAAVFIGIWLFARLQSVFMPFVIGFSLAYVVNVALSGLQSISIPLPKGKSFRLPKGAAFAILVALLIGALAFFALGIVPQLIEQAGAMKDGITSFYSRAKDYTLKTLEDLQNGEYPFKSRLPKSWQIAIDGSIGKANEYLQQRLPTAANRAMEILAGILASLSSGLIGTMGQISSGVFILIIFIYATQSFWSHMERIKALIPQTQRERIGRYAVEIDTNMRAFLRGELAVIVVISIISIIGYSIIRVPFALLVGLLAGLCNAIPTIGPILGGGIAILASIVGFVAGNYGLTGFLIQLILVIGVAFGIQLLDNSFISPRIMSRAVEVHPLIVLFAVLLSANFVGVWGAILAIPGVVVFKAIIKVSGELRAEAQKAGIEAGALEIGS